MKNKKILFAIIVDNSKSIICQNGIKINCSHILLANKNFTFAIFDIFFLYPAIFDNLPPYSTRSTVPVSGAQTGTVPLTPFLFRVPKQVQQLLTPYLFRVLKQVQ